MREQLRKKRDMMPCDTVADPKCNKWGYGLQVPCTPSLLHALSSPHHLILMGQIDLFNWNYNRTRGGAENASMLLDSRFNVDINCVNCYTYLGIGVGLEFETG